MRHFNATEVAAALPFNTLVPALHEAFVRGCEVPPRHPHNIGPAGTALLMPAWREGGFLGVKTVTIFPANGTQGLPGVHAIYTLFSARTGVPLAVMDGSELTSRRTAAASALAAQLLSRPDARCLALVGAGRVASLMPDALRSVRPALQQVRVWNRHPAAAQQLAQHLRSQGFDATASTALEDAVRGADIVSCATLATQALVQGDWLAPGTHVDLVGSFTPTMREADGRTLARSRVWVDTEEALAKSGDLLQAVAEGAFDPAALQGTLATLCRGEAPRRHREDDITLFKSVGTALEDLAAAEQVWASADNAGHP